MGDGHQPPLRLPAERAERQRQRDALLTPEGRRRLRHGWVDVASSFNHDRPGPGVVVEWARNRDLWYARAVYVQDSSTVIDGWFPYTRLSPVPR